MVYTSRPTVPPPKRAAFPSEISDTSLRKNPPRGITGGLLIASDLVVQLVEGPQDSISTLMATLRADERHAGIEVVHDAVSAERNMPEWAMAVRDVTDTPTSIQQIHTVVEDYRRSFRFRRNDLLMLMRSRLDLE